MEGKPGSDLKVAQKISAIKFGWKAIEDMFSREIQRMKDGQSCLGGLKSNFIHRDSLTRLSLNVCPAKILQVWHS